MNSQEDALHDGAIGFVLILFISRVIDYAQVDFVGNFVGQLLGAANSN